MRTRLSCDRLRPQRMLDVTHGYTTRPSVPLRRAVRRARKFPRQGRSLPSMATRNSTPYDDCVLVMLHHTTEKNKRVLRFARRTVERRKTRHAQSKRPQATSTVHEQLAHA